MNTFRGRRLRVDRADPGPVPETVSGWDTGPNIWRDASSAPAPANRDRNAADGSHVDAGKCLRVRSRGCQGGSLGATPRGSWLEQGRISQNMENRQRWARTAALTAGFAFVA